MQSSNRLPCVLRRDILWASVKMQFTYVFTEMTNILKLVNAHRDDLTSRF